VLLEKDFLLSICWWIQTLYLCED